MVSDRNSLLAELPPDTSQRLQAKMSAVSLDAREVLAERNRSSVFVYFVTDGLVSLAVGFADGFRAEVGLVGREGMIGLSAFNGAKAESADAVVQMPGGALRMKADELRREAAASPELGAVLRRYGEAMWMQAIQIAACNGHHGLEQRLARWLLMVDDRIGGRVLRVTQEELATVLCVHRPSVSVAAGRLQKAGLIRYSGGSLTIESRSGLEQAACECYQVLRRRR